MGNSLSGLELLVLLCLIGIPFLIASYLVKVITKKRNASCTEKVKGKVIIYFYLKEGVLPVLEFMVNGKRYTTRKKFNAILYKRVTGLPNAIEAEMYEDENNNLCLNAGTLIKYDELAGKLWPIGSEMDVYYNPENPKVNYVDRPVANIFLTKLLCWMGILWIVAGILFSLLATFA